MAIKCTMFTDGNNPDLFSFLDVLFSLNISKYKKKSAAEELSTQWAFKISLLWGRVILYTVYFHFIFPSCRTTLWAD